MSRSGYTNDGETWDLIRWRGAVTSALRGKRGQQALREILAALEALPEKKLAAESLVTADGAYCTLGALGRARGIDMRWLDPEDRRGVAQMFDIADAMAAEIMFMNDEGAPVRWRRGEIVGPMRPWVSRYALFPVEGQGALRWQMMRDWVEKQITGEKGNE